LTPLFAAAPLKDAYTRFYSRVPWLFGLRKPVTEDWSSATSPPNPQNECSRRGGDSRGLTPGSRATSRVMSSPPKLKLQSKPLSLIEFLFEARDRCSGCSSTVSGGARTASNTAPGRNARGPGGRARRGGDRGAPSPGGPPSLWTQNSLTDPEEVPPPHEPLLDRAGERPAPRVQQGEAPRDQGADPRFHGRVYAAGAVPDHADPDPRRPGDVRGDRERIEHGRVRPPEGEVVRVREGQVARARPVAATDWGDFGENRPGAREEVPPGRLPDPGEVHVTLGGQPVAEINQKFKIIGDIWDITCHTSRPRWTDVGSSAPRS